MFLLLHGPDEYSAAAELAKLRESDRYDFNQDVFSGAEGDLETIRTTCETFPFLSECRLVIVEGLPKRKRGKAGDGEDGEEAPPEPPPVAAGSKGKRAKSSGPSPRAFADGLAQCAATLPPTTTLVVIVPEELEASNPLVKAAQQHGKVRLCKPLRGTQLENWLQKRAAAADAKLPPDAVRALVAATGEDMRVLASEVQKLATYVGPGGEIRPEHVRTLTPPSREARIFDLTDALARRDRTRALRLLHELLAAGESPLGIVALTAFQTRALLLVKSLADRGLRVPQIASTAGMAPFVVEKSLPLTRQFTYAQLEAAHRALLDVDTALKRSRMTPEMALDLLVMEFGSVPTERHA